MIAAILTGGHARRLLGQDKSRLVVDAAGGRTILDRQLEMLAPLAAEILVVTSAARLPAFAPLDGTRAGAARLRVVTDHYPGAGPLGGVLTALEAADADVLVLGGDMPNVTAALARALLAAHEAAGADVTAPESPRGLEPLAAVYSPAGRAPLLRAFHSGNLSLQHALRTLRLRILPAAETARCGAPEALFRNINTPEDLS